MSTLVVSEVRLRGLPYRWMGRKEKDKGPWEARVKEKG